MWTLTYPNGELNDEADENPSICKVNAIKSEVNNPIDGLSVSWTFSSTRLQAI